MTTITQKQIIFEYDRPVQKSNLLNYCAGIWQWTLAPGVVTVTDDQSETGYYDEVNAVKYSIRSMSADGIDFPLMASLAECLLTDGSFFVDTATSKIYIHFIDSEPQLDKLVLIGCAVGFVYQGQEYYYNNIFYEPRVSKIPALKKNIDPLFYGLLQYNSGSVDFLNQDGYFDNWRSLNLYGQKCRILMGDYGDEYDDLEIVFEGFISNDKRDWSKFSLTIQDPRKGLEQPVCERILTLADYPDIDDSNVDTAIPVVYGSVINAPAICVTGSDEYAGSIHTFFFCDSTYNTPSALTAWEMIDEVPTALSPTIDYAAGTFTVPVADITDPSNVFCSFTCGESNGADIIVDLMVNYDGKTYLSTFWDTTEVAEAITLSRDTSLYISERDTKLSEAIESVCKDCDARFFTHDDGTYTIRIYDPDRASTSTIYDYEWLDEPNVVNNGDQFLSSVRIGYKRDIDSGNREYYENLDYDAAVFAQYRKRKIETFETELMTLADATDKSETIMGISSNISDIIDRTTTWDHADIEIGDFITAAPASRITDTDSWGIYEVMSVNKDLEKLEVKLSMRYIEAYTPVVSTYYTFIDESANVFTDENDNTFIGAE